MSVVLSELKQFLITNAATYGAMTDTREVAAALNSNLGATPIDVPTVSKADLVDAITVPAEYAALTAVQRDAWQMVLSLDDVPVKKQSIRDLVLLVWAAGTTTRSNLAALQQRLPFHSEILGPSSALGDRVTYQQVSEARNL